MDLPTAKRPSSFTRNQVPNSPASVSARQTRDLGARIRIFFSIRSVLFMGNLLVALLPRAGRNATPWLLMPDVLALRSFPGSLLRRRLRRVRRRAERLLD